MRPDIVCTLSSKNLKRGKIISFGMSARRNFRGGEPDLLTNDCVLALDHLIGIFKVSGLEADEWQLWKSLGRHRNNLLSSFQTEPVGKVVTYRCLEGM